MALFDLDATYPLISNAASEGAAQLREIKTAIKASFPAFGAGTDVVTVTAAALNGVAPKNAVSTISAVWTFSAQPVFSAGVSLTGPSTSTALFTFAAATSFTAGLVTFATAAQFTVLPTFLAGATFTTVAPTSSAGFTFNTVSPSATVPFKFADGSVALPSMTFTSDTDLGIYKATATNGLGVSCAVLELGSSVGVGQVDIRFRDETGTTQWGVRKQSAAGSHDLEFAPYHSDVVQTTTMKLLNSAGGVGGSVVQVRAGTQAVPAISFLSDTDCGFYSAGSEKFGVAATAINLGSSIGDNLVDLNFVNESGTNIWTIRRRTLTTNNNLFEIFRTVVGVPTQCLNINFSTGKTSFQVAPGVTGGGTLIPTSGTPLVNEVGVFNGAGELQTYNHFTYHGAGTLRVGVSPTTDFQVRLATSAGMDLYVGAGKTGGWARGFIVRDVGGTPLSGYGFLGNNTTPVSFRVGQGSDWFNTGTQLTITLATGAAVFSGTVTAASFPSPTFTGTVTASAANFSGAVTVPTVTPSTDSDTSAASTSFVQTAMLNRYSAAAWSVADNVAIPGATSFFGALTTVGEHDPGLAFSEVGGEITVGVTGYYRVGYSLPVNSISATAHTVWACISLDGVNLASTIRAENFSAIGVDAVLAADTILQITSGQIVSLTSKASTNSRSEVGLVASLDGDTATGVITIQKLN